MCTICTPSKTMLFCKTGGSEKISSQDEHLTKTQEYDYSLIIKGGFEMCSVQGAIRNTYNLLNWKFIVKHSCHSSVIYSTLGCLRPWLNCSLIPSTHTSTLKGSTALIYFTTQQFSVPEPRKTPVQAVYVISEKAGNQHVEQGSKHPQTPASGFCEYALIHIFHAHRDIQIYNKRFVKMAKWFEWCHENLCKGKF